MTDAPLPEAPRSLVLLRHGQTAWNVDRRIQGQSDSVLDEAGHDQALAVAEDLVALRPVHLWTSDLSRAASTAAYVGKACGLDPVPDARLREYALGSREGLLHEEYAAAHPDEFAAFLGGDFDVVPGGERTLAVAERMTAVVQDLLALTPAGGLSIAVTHGAALKVAVAALLGWDRTQAGALGSPENCGWTLLRESPATGTLRLQAYNRVAAPRPGPDFA